MTFQELKEEIENEFGIIKLADIAIGSSMSLRKL